MSADQWDGSHGKPDARIQSEQLRANAADYILNCAHQHGKKKKFNYPDAALLQHTEGCHVAHAAEKARHKYILQRCVHLKLHNTRTSQHQMQERENQPADHRRRYAVALQKLNALHQHPSDEQHNNRKTKRLIHIKFQNLHSNLLLTPQLRLCTLMPAANALRHPPVQ